MGGTKYEVRIAPAAVRQLKKLPQTMRERVVHAMEGLSNDPRPKGVEKLSQNPRLWRVRVGDYRLVYWIDDESKVLITLIVRHRKDAYRDIDKLDPSVVAKTITPLLSGLSSGI
jgi:mRNA interferase RelE/StbE